MSLDPELDPRRHQWQACDAMPAHVRRRVDRDIRWMRLGFLSAVAVTVIFGGGTIAWAILSGDADIVVVAMATWVFIAATWAVSLMIQGGLGQWKPASTTTVAFLDFSIRNRVAARRAIVAATVLYAAFAAFMLAWRFQNPAGEAPTDVWSYLAARWVFWTITALLAVIAVWRGRALGRELEVLREFRQGGVRGLSRTSFVWPDVLPLGIEGFEDLTVLFCCSRENRGLIRMDLDEATALFKLVHGIENARGVEVGRFKGGGTFLIAAALRGEGHLLSIDIAPEDDQELDRALTACRLRHKVELVVGNSAVIDRDEEYDFVVIDGGHSYSVASSDHVRWGAKVRVGGFVIHHDMGYARPGATQIEDLRLLRQQILHHQRDELVIAEEVGSLVVFQRKDARWTAF